MRGLFYALSVAAVIGLAFWAYNEGYETRALERSVARLERQIGARHQALSMLHAEWAYLNRPDRLHELAEMNFESLGLEPLSPGHFAAIDQVGYPPPEPRKPTKAESKYGDVPLGTIVDDVVIMNHVFGADTAPKVIAPPNLADDGEQLP